MRMKLRGVNLVLALLIAAGTLAGLAGARARWHVEARNRRVEIALEWDEVSRLAQAAQKPLPDILTQFRAQGVSTLVIAEETLGSLEQGGAARVTRVFAPSGSYYTDVALASPLLLPRIAHSLQTHGIRPGTAPTDRTDNVAFFTLHGTRFHLQAAPDGGASGVTNAGTSGATEIYISAEYNTLRTLGMGLPADAVKATQAARLHIAARTGNFAGIGLASAQAVLSGLHAQGAGTIIFNGDDVMGYRGLEKAVAGAFRDPAAPTAPAIPGDVSLAPTGMAYGAVEFGKQRGDETVTSALRGDYVRVHSIQIAEMGQLSPDEIIDRFVRAVRERNIRFCYVRLLTLAGDDPAGENIAFVKKIAQGMERGSEATGGGLEFGPARRFAETGVSRLVFALVGLGVAGGFVWMLRAVCSLPDPASLALLGLAGLTCAGLSAQGETGRRLTALLAGVAFPALACLITFPRPNPPRDPRKGMARTPTSTSSLASGSPSALASTSSVPSVWACLGFGLRGLALASAITGLGVVHVVGLLATRPFLLRASQFLGIKAQHAIPILLIALVALAGGAASSSETWKMWQARAFGRWRAAWDEPARFGLLLVGLAALAALALVVARTGNDAGVGVSSGEMSFRASLEHLLPVRPRTKEFLIGHPAFLLALAWHWRGRRRLALPCFVIGSLGQVSLLNTFCHIHTPLVISLWHGGLGLVAGALLGAAVFIAVETLLPKPPVESSNQAERALETEALGAATNGVPRGEAIVGASRFAAPDAVEFNPNQG